MTARQRHELDTMLRTGPMDLRGDLAEQRQVFTDMVTAQPLPDDVRTSETTLGGVDATALDEAARFLRRATG